MKDGDRQRNRAKANRWRKNRIDRKGGHHDTFSWKKNRRRQRQFKRMVLILCLPALLGAGACAGSWGAGQASGGDGRPDRQAKGAEEQKAFLEFAECMRKQGVPMPDPEFKGSGEVAAVRIGGPDVSPEKMQKAHKACRKYLPESLSQDRPQLSKEDQDAFLAFSRCMRQNGIDMPDPKPGDGGLVLRMGDPNAPDPESVKYKEAEKHCRKHLAPVDRRINKEQR